MTYWIMKSLHHWFGVVFAAFFAVLSMSGVWLTLNDSILPSSAREFLSPVTDFMRKLHVNLLNPFGLGHDIVIWTGLIGVFLTVLGMLIFIPQWRIFRRQEMFVPREFSFRSLRRSHATTGIVFSMFVALFSLTGWAVGEPEQAAAILGEMNINSSETFHKLHTGEGYGILYQLLICLLGIIMMSIAVTGLLSYMTRWNKKIARIVRKRRVKYPDET